MIDCRKYLLLTLLVPTGLFSQSFDSINNQWVQTGANLVGSQFPFYVELVTDTTINDKQYRTAYIQNAEFSPSPKYVGAVRQENDSVYVVPAESNTLQEFLIYDWSILPGDTLSRHAFSWVVLDSITTISLTNNQERQKFDCSRYTIQFGVDTIRAPLTIIENIGCIDCGFILDPFFDLPESSFQLPSSPEGLRCYSSGGELLWQNEEIINCDSITVSADNILSDQSFSIAPNPVKDILFIRFADQVTGYDKVDVSIVDINGVVRMEIQQLLETQSLEVPVNELTSGIYFVFLDFGLVKKQILKFVKV